MLALANTRLITPTLKLHIPLALAVPAVNFTFTALSMHHSGHSTLVFAEYLEVKKHLKDVA